MAVNTDRSPTEKFFHELAERGREPVLKNTTGTIRFDIADGEHTEHWYVDINKGDVDISHKDAAADAALRIDKKDFDKLADGTMNAMASVIRGAVIPQGDFGLMLLFQRVFPGPPRGWKGAASV